MSQNAGAPTTPESRDTQFHAIEGGSSEVASGSTLLVEAYAAIWVILLAFLLVSWRRQSKLDAKMTELERAIAAARGGGK
jgi:CcmD family protein